MFCPFCSWEVQCVQIPHGEGILEILICDNGVCEVCSTPVTVEIRHDIDPKTIAPLLKEEAEKDV